MTHIRIHKLRLFLFALLLLVGCAGTSRILTPQKTGPVPKNNDTLVITSSQKTDTKKDTSTLTDTSLPESPQKIDHKNKTSTQDNSNTTRKKSRTENDGLDFASAFSDSFYIDPLNLKSPDFNVGEDSVKKKLRQYPAGYLVTCLK